MFARKPRSDCTGATRLDSAAGSRLVQLPMKSRLESPRLIRNVGLSFAVEYVSNVWTDETLKFCSDTFVRKCKGRKNPYTVESTIMGQHIIFTADPENIKAVLATQFWEFEKGERFRKDWIGLLGHSMSAYFALPLWT
jgi:hypothetical protein